MPTPKRPLKVFLCHAHADRDPVRGLYTRLTQDGVDAWLDKAKLLPGQDWELEIRKAVREADVVVVCLSKQFNQAGFRQKEVRLALDTAMEKPEGEIFIIPARLEECDNLESLRRWHWVDLFEDDGYEMLMRALRARADRIGATLQIKKSWLPKVTTPSVKSEKPILEKKPTNPKSVPVKIEEKRGEAPKPKIENPKPSKTQRMQNTVIIIALIGIVAALFGLSLIEKWFTPLAAPTVIMTITDISSTPISTFEVPSKTPIPVAPQNIKRVSISGDTNLDFILIPTGNLINISGEQVTSHTVQTDKSFYMSIYEVTWDQIIPFLNEEATAYPDGLGSWDWSLNNNTKGIVRVGALQESDQIFITIQPKLEIKDEYKHYPASALNFYVAEEYAKWLSNKTGFLIRLPTKNEWEYAASGGQSIIYPWGDSWIAGIANFGIEGKADTAEVGTYSSNGFGLYDMCGNVREWTTDVYTGPDTNKWADNPILNIMKGGDYFGYNNNYETAKLTCQIGYDDDEAIEQGNPWWDGIRLVMDTTTP